MFRGGTVAYPERTTGWETGTLPESPRATGARTFVWSITGSLIASLALVALVYRIDPSFHPSHAAAGDLALVLLNALPIAPVALLLFALTRRPVFAVWCSGLLALTLYRVSELKLQYLATPLLPADFRLVGQIGGGNGVLLHYIPTNWAQLLIYAAILAATVATLVLPPRVRLRPRSRGLLATVAVAAGASLLVGVTPWKELYSKERYDFQPWAPAYSVERTGLIASLLMHQWMAPTPSLRPPDRAVVEKLLARIAQHAGPEYAAATGTDPADPPDIVVLQSESFFDASRLNGVAPDQFAPSLRGLAQDALHGDLWVPTYGGGTIRTEFEVLTGIALRYFPQVHYPYYGLLVPQTPSLASVLGARGYRTLAVHPNSSDFWNRATAFRTMGFDAFDDEASFGESPREGYFVSDEALVDHILKRLDEQDGPTFIFAISMENHGPYDSSPDLDAGRLEAIPVPADMPHGAAEELRHYLYHADQADRSLGRLADALSRRPRRSLLLFYGDHLPSLPDVYESVGFVDGTSHDAQPVPYVLIDSAKATAQSEDSASYFLAARLLQLAGIDDPYFRALDVVRKATHFAPGYTPAGDPDLGELMAMRRVGEWPAEDTTPGVEDVNHSP